MKPLRDMILLSLDQESETPSFRHLLQQDEVQFFPGLSQLQTPVVKYHNIQAIQTLQYLSASS
jgi:hypothetical protein